MRPIKHTTYMTIDELATHLQAREATAEGMPDGPAKQAFLEQTARLHSYLDMKRLLTPQR